jgi:hypothetical protein
VLEYLIKSGSERVSQQCKENLFSIQTLKDFQYMDKEGKDQGVSSEWLGCGKGHSACLNSRAACMTAVWLFNTVYSSYGCRMTHPYRGPLCGDILYRDTIHAECRSFLEYYYTSKYPPHSGSCA